MCLSFAHAVPMIFQTAEFVRFDLHQVTASWIRGYTFRSVAKKRKKNQKKKKTRTESPTVPQRGLITNGSACRLASFSHMEFSQNGDLVKSEQVHPCI
jgi:hypothetical protein